MMLKETDIDKKNPQMSIDVHFILMSLGILNLHKTASVKH